MNWMLTSGGVTKDFATWGLGKLTRTRRSFAADTVTFVHEGAAIDDAPLFPYHATIQIAGPDGKGWFTGVVTRTPLRGNAKGEDQTYEVSGPWHYLERVVFQQEWSSWDGINNKLISTLQSRCIINQNFETGLLIDLGQVTQAVVDFVTTTCAGATPPIVPFEIGRLLVDTKLPFTEVSDLTCAQVLITIFQWIPDAVAWFDYTTPVPTLNIARRADLASVALAAYNGIVEAIDLTPRKDLVVPSVVVKYKQLNTYDGATFNQQFVQKYPPTAPDPQLDALVLDLQLLPGQATFQHQAITVVDRPLDYNAYTGDGHLVATAKDWMRNKTPWLKSYLNASGGVVNVADTDFSILKVETTLDANTPDPKPDAKLLKSELISGNVTPWMTETANVKSATATISITIQYIGADPIVASQFGANNLLTLHYTPITITNGQSQDYEQLTSQTPAEPAPQGLAQALYEGLSVLHYEGMIGLGEEECSGLVGVHTLLNLTGGRAEWATMNAQVIEVTEDIVTGKTKVRTGPPRQLSGSERLDMIRANRGRVQSWHLQERTTGKAGQDNAIQGTGPSPLSAMTHAPTPVVYTPFQVLTRLNPVTLVKEYKVILQSTLFQSPAGNDNLAITGLDTWTAFPAATTGWFYLKASVGDYVVTPGTPTILVDGPGGDFVPNSAPWNAGAFVEDDGGTPPQQKYLRVLIANYDATQPGPPVIMQKLFSDLILQNCCFDGYAAIYPSAKA